MKRFLFSLCLLLTAATATRGADQTFAIDGNQILLDSKPFQIMCGEMHYSRIPVEYWQDRLRRVKAMGLNTVAAYVFWNVHEPEPGKFNFSGDADVAQFCRLAQKEGLYVYLRPGPYCCAEWEFGGFPYWLLKDRDIKIRSKDPKFVAAVRAYDAALGKQLAPLQITHGGPIIMVQCENEYGSFGKDKEYLGDVQQSLKDAGFDVPFCTVDGGPQSVNGSIAGLIPGINGGNAADTKKFVDKLRPGGPYFVGEFYPGWLDHWGEPFAKHGAAGAAKGLEDLAAGGVSFNIYMVHGGTNFGFMNGSNNPPFGPSITSYDYDAPIGEAGNLTPKYFKMRDVLMKYAPPGSVPTPPADNPVATFPAVTLSESVTVADMLPKAMTSEQPTCFEDLNQPYGFVLYRTKVEKATQGVLSVQRGIRDYAIISVNGKVVATFDRRIKKAPQIMLDLPAGATLDLLVENMGRVNYGNTIRDNLHGLTGAVTVGDQELHGWQNFSLPMTDVASLKFSRSESAGVPAFYRGSFGLKSAGDAFIDLQSWGKGVVWVNGHNLGRFWNIGPQQTLYAPGPWLKAGANQIVVLEEKDTGHHEVAGVEKPVLDHLVKPATRPDVPHGG